MGSSLPVRIGAQYGQMDRQVVCITGDGGLVMNIQELATISFHRLPVKIIVMNNKEYGIIKQTQGTWLKSRYVASDESGGLGSPDLTRIAKAYDVQTMEISNDQEIDSKLAHILNSEKAILCDVKVRKSEKITPELTYDHPLENLWSFLDRKQLRDDLIF